MRSAPISITTPTGSNPLLIFGSRKRALSPQRKPFKVQYTGSPTTGL